MIRAILGIAIAVLLAGCAKMPIIAAPPPPPPPVVLLPPPPPPPPLARTDLYNDRLSLQRAGRISRRLIELGIASERIQTSGRGKRELLVPTADQVADPRNRRVEIVVR